MIALRILEQVWCTISPPLAPSCGVNQKASTFPWPLADGWQLAIGSGSGLLGAITVHNLNTGMLASRPGRGRRRASQPSQVTQKTALNMADKAGRRIGQAASRDMILQARRSMHENSWLDYLEPNGHGGWFCFVRPSALSRRNRSLLCSIESPVQSSRESRSRGGRKQQDETNRGLQHDDGYAR